MRFPAPLSEGMATISAAEEQHERRQMGRLMQGWRWALTRIRLDLHRLDLLIELGGSCRTAAEALPGSRGQRSAYWAVLHGMVWHGMAGVVLNNGLEAKRQAWAAQGLTPHLDGKHSAQQGSANREAHQPVAVLQGASANRGVSSWMPKCRGGAMIPVGRISTCSCVFAGR